MFYKIAKNNIMYVKYYTEPGSDIVEKVTLIPTGEDSGDPELINVKDLEQGFTYNIDKTILNTDYKIEESSNTLELDKFEDIKKEIKETPEPPMYTNFISSMISNKDIDNLVLLPSEGESPEDYGINSSDVNNYFEIYKVLLKHKFKVNDIAKAVTKFKNKKSPEYELYLEMQKITPIVIKEYREKKKKEIFSQFEDISLPKQTNHTYDMIYKIYCENNKGFTKPREKLLSIIYNRLLELKKVDSDFYFSIPDFNKYIKEQLFLFLENLYITNKHKFEEKSIPKEDAIKLLAKKKELIGSSYTEECRNFDYNDFDLFISNKYNQISESLLTAYEATEKSDTSKKEVFNLIRERAIEINPELEQYKNKVNIDSFEDVLNTDNDEYNSYKEYLYEVVNIIKSVDPSLTIYGLISFYAYSYGLIKLRKTSSIIPIIRLIYGIELVKQDII